MRDRSAVTTRAAMRINSSTKRESDEARHCDIEDGGIDVEVILFGFEEGDIDFEDDDIDFEDDDIDFEDGDIDFAAGDFDVEVGDPVIADEPIVLHKPDREEAMTIAMPSEKQMDKLLKELNVVNDGIDRFVTLLSTPEKRRSLKPRRGGEAVGEKLVTLVNERKLQITGLSPGEIVAQRARAARLRPLQLAAERLARSLGDAVFAAESKAWSTTTDLYSVLKKMSHRDESLKTQLAPVTQFFALGKRKPKPTPVPAPAAK
jgi:hypothetical protein